MVLAHRTMNLNVAIFRMKNDEFKNMRKYLETLAEKGSSRQYYSKELTPFFNP
mgnify:CR=1